MAPAASENFFHPNLSVSSPARIPKVTCVHLLFAADWTALATPNPTPAGGLLHPVYPCATVWEDCSDVQDGWLDHVVLELTAPVSHACTAVAVHDGAQSSSRLSCAEMIVDP